ncbi:glycosyltransferase family 39 protein [Glycomyces sp. TRM65418]|uniref:glycosyltransferase family 39 protein n=1 Tax=Glycomyces sp. TRM65418 TaxID=2867006 RepID=UPI001CE69095|nr:glycosyltransferase family 39 protein [Glycomyces sp. TRM65418]MCC3764426.1 glycosyltransferase family 39 protein [Glycomyces sp. TRM65418]QZD54101.1 glycosyltransferase family 39 protein [Glycomyces sp. TRM65418]
MRPPLFRLHPALASLALAAVLSAVNGRYDYHRDELYFLILERAWGYVDQGPLTPLLGHLSIAVFGDTVWAFRFPSVLCMVGMLWLAALLTRELGGGRAAQALCVWGLAFAGVALAFGHVLSTATVDLVVWTAVLLFAVRALLRDRPQWWLAVGAVAGIGLYNKHLIVLLLISLGAALLAVGPRRALVSRWLWAGVALAFVIGSPNLIYQAQHGWPQLEMASAIAEGDGAENRITLLPFQFLLLGLFLVPIWVTGLIALLRRPAWRPVRALAVAYPVLLAIVLAAGGQMYYSIGLVVALYAAGCAPVAAWAASQGRRALLVAAVGLNTAVSAVVALPLIPVEAVGDTPIPAMNDTVPDQIGWQTYARQASVFQSMTPEEKDRTVTVTANYGEAGALLEYAVESGPVYSGHNELFAYGPPPESATTVITVGLPLDRMEEYFDECLAVAVLDNNVGVENEEQGRTVGVCRGRTLPWAELWPEFRHYD